MSDLAVALGVLAAAAGVASTVGGAVVWWGRQANTRRSAGQLAPSFDAVGLELHEATARGGRPRFRSPTPRGTLWVELEANELGRGSRVHIELHRSAPMDEAPLQVHFGEQTWFVLGDEARAAGLASGRLRDALGPNDQLHISQGSLSLIVHEPAGAGPAARALLDLHHRLELSQNHPQPTSWMLQNLAFDDPSPAARAGAIPSLLAYHPGLADRLAEDRAPEVRLAVATAAGGELGFRVASEIATSEILHPSAQQGAIRWLAARYEPERVTPVLVSALHSAEEGVLHTLVGALSALGQRGVVQALLDELPTASARVVARIVEALVELEAPELEATLLPLLERSARGRGPDALELRTAVVDGLGRVGSRRALEPLHRLAEEVPPESSLGLSLRVALDLVRSRVGDGGGVGALALAEEGGELSPHPKGQLS